MNVLEKVRRASNLSSILSISETDIEVELRIADLSTRVRMLERKSGNIRYFDIGEAWANRINNLGQVCAFITVVLLLIYSLWLRGNVHHL